MFTHLSQDLAPHREVRSVSPAWWICCPFALFINCWIHLLSIGSFSVSCYTTIELQPRCRPSFLMGTGDCGAALLPWQQALSHSPHIACSVHVVPSKLERATADTGLLSDRTTPGLFTSRSDAKCPHNPATHTPPSILFITNAQNFPLAVLTYWPLLQLLVFFFFRLCCYSSHGRMVKLCRAQHGEGLKLEVLSLPLHTHTHACMHICAACMLKLEPQNFFFESLKQLTIIA